MSQSSPAPTSSLRSPTAADHDLVSNHVVSPQTSAPPAPAPPPPPPPEASASAPAQTTPTETMSPAVQAYQTQIMDDALAACIAQSKKLGGIVEQHVALLEPLCSAQLAFLEMASKHSKPSANTLLPLLKPQADAIQAVMETKETLNRSKKGREWGTCLSTVSEGVSAWGWVQVEPAPAPFVTEMKSAAQFWGDRVIKQFKETNPDAVAWSKSFSDLLDQLQKYVKQWHTTGVAWNPKGPPAPSSISTTNAPSAGSAPPPPPPPPPIGTTSSAPAAGGQAALLAALNRGGAVTSGLKKVDPSQMTHKNPDLRASGTVPDTSVKRSPPALKPKPGSSAPTTTKKPARLELEGGNKWLVENQEDNKNIVIEDTELNHTVHIFSCKNSVIKISGKINAVSMVGCKKTAVVLDTAVSTLSITSSPSFEVQITGTIPTIQIDTTDSGSIYLSKECMEKVEIITSKTSSINISVPTGEEGDFEEKPIPEQMRSKIVSGKIITEIVEHAG
ncbi:hypothetical protein TREMEDRAFT_42219 [Tremella mesenterica DSM 1558]|nr:uncharacterized protein TREMEDRAFT_42219 [Tremella mesenterica DSM 1558]EIW73160.1 hypothetical protein TREMEDRAFT_42219 [Tremella mesenterica DSM 1558]